MNKVNDKKCILAIETTSNICGIAIIKDKKVLYENNLDKGLNHSITLFDNIDYSLKKTRLTIKDIDIIKVSNGPGSFTGLRIGIAAALGLSKPNNTLIEYVDTLDSLANNIFMKKSFILKNSSKFYVLSMIDARVDRIYTSLYNGLSKEKLSYDSIITIDELCYKLNKYFINKNIMFALVGSGAINYKKTLKDKLRINYKIFDNDSNLLASSIAYTKGVISMVPFTNYMIASKAEREKNNNL